MPKRLKTMRTRHIQRRQRTKQAAGAIFVEIVLLFPIFLVLISGAIWIATYLNARVALTTAMSNSLRLAVTRGNSMLTGNQIIAAVQQLKATGNSTAVTPYLSNGISDFKSFYNSKTLKPIRDFSNPNGAFTSINAAPAEMIYALIYVNQAMKVSIGSIRFPCDPLGTSEGDGPGCLKCEISQIPGTDAGTGVTMKTAAHYKNNFTMMCQFLPGDPMTMLLSRVGGMVAGGGDLSLAPLVITRTRYVEITTSRIVF